MYVCTIYICMYYVCVCVCVCVCMRACMCACMCVYVCTRGLYMYKYYSFNEFPYFYNQVNFYGTHCAYTYNCAS